MAYDEIGSLRRRYPVAAVVSQLEETPSAIPGDDDAFVCEACRRELPIADRSRLKDARCRACV